MAADRIHIAQPAPAHCTGCFQAKPHMRHVDFGAFYDGPVMQAAIGTLPHVIDDLILCEDCLRDAGRLVGLGDATQLNERIEALEQLRNDLGERLTAALAHIDQLEKALVTREQLHQALPQRRPAKAKAAAR